jgi:hypothetical protein
MDPADGSQIQNDGKTFSISSGTDTFFNDTWHHVVAQYNPGYPNNNGYIKLYIDGVSQGETSIGNHQMGINYGHINGIRFGSTNHGNWTPASMKIDDTKIYNYILTKTQIKRLAQPKILHYKFDDRREEATENLYKRTSLMPGGTYPYTISASGKTVISGKKDPFGGTDAVLVECPVEANSLFRYGQYNGDNLDITIGIEYSFSVYAKIKNVNKKPENFSLDVGDTGKRDFVNDLETK